MPQSGTTIGNSTNNVYLEIEEDDKRNGTLNCCQENKFCSLLREKYREEVNIGVNGVDCGKPMIWSALHQACVWKWVD